MSTWTHRTERAAKLRAIYDSYIEHHVIMSRHIIDDGRAIFRLGKPGGYCEYAAEVGALGFGTVFVNGDVDAVVFGICSYKGWRQKLGWMSGKNYDYAEEKASIGSSCSEMARVLDPDVAAADIVYFRRHKYISKETARAALDRAEDDDVRGAQERIYEDSCDYELTISSCTACRVIMAQALITKLCTLLDVEELVASQVAE